MNLTVLRCHERCMRTSRATSARRLLPSRWADTTDMKDRHHGRQTVAVTFKFVGPLKRTTFSQETPDPTEEAVGDLLHWSWSVRLQFRRLTKSLREEFKAWNNRPSVYRQRHFSKTSYDEHMLTVAGGNLDRAIRRAKKPVRQVIQISKDAHRGLWLLRHNYEHWDELRGAYRKNTGQLSGAAAKLKREFPNADPWSLKFDPESGEIILANVVPLTPLVNELRDLEKELLKIKGKSKEAGR